MKNGDTANARGIRQTSMLPATSRKYAQVENLRVWNNWLWHEAPLCEVNLELLRTYTSLIVDSAFSHPAALDCLVAVSRSTSMTTKSVAISAQRHNYSNRHTILGFSEKTELAMYCWRDSKQYRHCIAIKPKRLMRQIENLLKSQFRDSMVVSKIEESLSYQDIRRLGPILALHAGADPYLMSAISGNIRPVSQAVDDPYQLTGISQESLNHLMLQSDVLSLRSEKIRGESSSATTDPEEIPASWVAESRKLLRNLCSDLGNAINGHADTPNKKRIAEAIFADYANRAALLGPVDSAVRVAIRYSRERFINDASISANTLRQYLDRSVISGLLDNENAFSLAEWDPDDFIENIEDRISSQKLMRRSKQAILAAYKPLVEFLVSELSLPPVSFAGLKQEYVGGAGQWRLISPHAIDALVLKLATSENREMRLCAVVIALGFYTGLRASEIRRLTLADIVFDDVLPNFDIECLRGKSTNSRRRIPFDKMAPTHIIDLVRDCWSNRKLECPRFTKLSAVALLGPEQSFDGYQYDSLVRLTRNVLKAAFGESVNVHLLRHCFCSYLFIRWYALRHPDLLNNLRDRSHLLFQPDLQSRLNTYFNCMPLEDGEIRPYDFISMIKLTGHASPETLFQYYVHSFSVVQFHAVAQMDKSVLQDRLSDSVIARLVPKLKSSASRMKLASRTIGGIYSAISNESRLSASIC